MRVLEQAAKIVAMIAEAASRFIAYCAHRLEERYGALPDEAAGADDKRAPPSKQSSPAVWPVEPRGRRLT
jgi:hypothetical protein